MKLKYGTARLLKDCTLVRRQDFCKKNHFKSAPGLKFQSESETYALGFPKSDPKKERFVNKQINMKKLQIY